ncbi:SGNH/GDSL hydrolase family protein [Candidatus Saccharibacteria bacterium]|nr:SGNH/GDSL hydrolase family protein [Candidatus Saccharibacteria bacterium]
MHHKLFKHLSIFTIIAITLIFSISASAISLSGKSILIDGDSVARGTHATVDNGRYSYGDYLASLGADVTNIAYSGSLFYYPPGGEDKMINHLTSDVTSVPYDYIILEGGDVDIEYHGNVDYAADAIDEYFATVKSTPAWQNSKVFFLITPHMDFSSDVLDKTNELWKRVKRLCTKHRIKCINLFKTSKDDGNTTPVGFNYNLMSNRISFSENETVEGSVDGEHPSKKAQITIGKIIAKRLRANNGDPSNPAEQNSSDEDNSYTPSISTYDGTVETSFFGNMQDDGQGCGVYTILSLVVDTLSIGVAILALIGIALTGVKYLMAKGDIEQAKNAKHRMYQIIVGLVAYVLLYAGVQWLLPGGHFNSNQSCSTTSAQKTS